MENLLAMPVRPIEVMLAKIVPYIVIGYVQVLLILAIAVGGVRPADPRLAAAAAARARAVHRQQSGARVTFSTIARNQMQAIQMAQFTLLPSFLLSGFMFPFKGMPVWAQWDIGEVSSRPRTRCASCAACC
jgi:ABC-2 type transport system permease protein